MASGEYAVLFAGLGPTPPADQSVAPGTPFCVVFSSLPGARAFASQQVAIHPTLRCRIYDHHGLSNEPVEEIHGAAYVSERDISPNFRRWAGSILFVGGLALTLLDWYTGFDLTWGATVGTRLFPIGAVLLLTELVLVFEAKRKRRSTTRHSTQS